MRIGRMRWADGDSRMGIGRWGWEDGMGAWDGIGV